MILLIILSAVMLTFLLLSAVLIVSIYWTHRPYGLKPARRETQK